MKYNKIFITAVIILIVILCSLISKSQSAYNKCNKFCSLYIPSNSFFKETCDNSCNLGCCTDLQGFKHNDYSKSLCENQNGQSSSNPCEMQDLCESIDFTSTLILDPNELDDFSN